MWEALQRRPFPPDQRPHPTSSAWWLLVAWVYVLLVSVFLIVCRKLLGQVIAVKRSMCAQVPSDGFWVRQIVPCN